MITRKKVGNEPRRWVFGLAMETIQLPMDKFIAVIEATAVATLEALAERDQYVQSYILNNAHARTELAAALGEALAMKLAGSK